MKQKKKYLDLLRVIAILMVFHFHFIICMERYDSFLFGFANGDWGCVGTTLFFLISGNCLARNYSSEIDIYRFYKKRWLALFPMFYICYLLFLFINTLILRNDVLGTTQLWRLIFSVLGIDNYMNFFGIANFAQVGEWYTTIILMIYIVFPVLRWAYNKNKTASTVLLGALYFTNIYIFENKVPDDAHLITGIFMFWMGMLIYHFEEKAENLPLYGRVVIGLAAGFLLLIKLPGPELIYKNLMAVLIFILFMWPKLYTDQKSIILSYLCRIEYAVYLCHHIILYKGRSFMLMISSEINIWIYYFLSLAVTLAFAAGLTAVTSKALKLRKKKTER